MIGWYVSAGIEPRVEPFDQQAPLTHFDVFVRPDQLKKEFLDVLDLTVLVLSRLS